MNVVDLIFESLFPVFASQVQPPGAATRSVSHIFAELHATEQLFSLTQRFFFNILLVNE